VLVVGPYERLPTADGPIPLSRSIGLMVDILPPLADWTRPKYREYWAKLKEQYGQLIEAYSREA
jgi:hypothetical protein